MMRFFMVMRGSASVFACAALLALGSAAAAQDGERFRARLSPVPVDASTVAGITGLGSVTAELKGTTLSLSGTFDGLRTPATIARVHRARRGMHGPAVFDLTVSKTTSGTIAGTLALTPAQVEDVRNGRFYVQLHSEKAPDGNLWGWLLRPER